MLVNQPAMAFRWQAAVNWQSGCHWAVLTSQQPLTSFSTTDVTEDRPEVIQVFSCSTQSGMKSIMLICKLAFKLHLLAWLLTF